jgi:hypothetical protein
MEHDPLAHQKQAAAAFWKAYFAKFRRRVEDHEPSQTQGATLSADLAADLSAGSSNAFSAPSLPFPDRRRPRPRPHIFTLLR